MRNKTLHLGTGRQSQLPPFSVQKETGSKTFVLKDLCDAWQITHYGYECTCPLLQGGVNVWLDKACRLFSVIFFFPTICSVSCCPWRHGYPLLNYAALPREWLCSSICILQYSLPFLPVYVDFHTTDVIRKLHLSLSCYFEQGNCDMSLKAQERICTANQNFRNWIHRITNFSKAVLLSMFSSPPLFSFEQNDFPSA